MADIKTPVGDAPLFPVILLATGGYLVWFGIHYWRSDVTWPSDPVKAMLTGKALPDTTPSEPSAHDLLSVDVQAVQSDPNTGPAGGGILPTPTGTQKPPIGVKGNYTHADLMQLWQSAGGSAKAANNAACHAIQESSGDPNATSSNPDGGTNYGLWQLDTKGKGAGYSAAQLKDPTTNARITVMATANGSNWSAWSTPGC